MSNDMTDRQSISENHGATNTLESGEFYDCLISTCDQIIDVLSDHCGPYASDALIIQNNTGLNLKDPHYAIFTKDGINIVKAIEFFSPIQKQIQNLVAYVGSRVDALSHDGTTTAMLFFTLLTSHYFNHIKSSMNNGTIPDRRKLKSDLMEALKDISDVLESKMVVTVEKFAESHKISHREAIRFVAFYQAMLSSKGDLELSNAIVEVVETLPKELYGLFTVSQSKIETDKRFTVIHDDFNFTLNVLSNPDDMNHRMYTEYLAESCDLIVSEDDIVRGNPAIETIFGHIVDAETNGLNRDLVIVAKSLDGSLQSKINLFNRSSHHKIIVFPMSIHNPYSSKVTILSAVMATASVYPLNEHFIDNSLPYIIHNAKVHYKNKRLFISNLYEKNETPYHPSFLDPTRFLPYTLMVTSIKEALEGYASGRLVFESASDRARFADYTDIYRRMISNDVRHLELSGMRHETMADHDVLQDSFGSVLSSLDHGFVFDGYLKFYYHLFKEFDRDRSGVRNVAVSAMLSSVVNILRFVHKQDVTKDASDNDEMVGKSRHTSSSLFTRRLTAVTRRPDLSVTISPPFDEFPTYLYYPIDGDPTDHHDLSLSEHNVPVIQPVDTYRELIRRMTDLLPKLLNTNRVMIPDTINQKVTK